MDFAKLLDESVPFDDNKLLILEKVVEIFYAPGTSQNDRKTANEILSRFTELETSPLYCTFILEKTKSNNTRVVAFNIFEKFIKERWNTIEQNSKLTLRNYLATLMVNFCKDDNFYLNPQNTFVINKLNILIVLIAKNDWTTTWPDFISQFCTVSKTNQNICENSMKILILLSEEINEFWKKSLTQRKAFELREKMKNEFDQVFELSKWIIDNSNAVKNELIVQSLKLFAEYTNWFPIQKALSQEIMLKMLQNFRERNACRTETMKCLQNLFSFKIDPRIFNGDLNQLNNYKLMLSQVFQTFIILMDTEITKGKNFADTYKQIYRNSPEKLNGFEKLTLSYENALISYIKSNFAFIQSHDYKEGTQGINEFNSNFMPQIVSALNYLTQFLQIDNEEIFKAAVDFWLWFSHKIFTLKDPEENLENYSNLLDQNNKIQTIFTKAQYMSYLQESFLYKNYYMKPIDEVRVIISTKMTKPLEVKIDVDEEGNIICDPTTNTIYQSIHEDMRDSLVYLTFIDPYKTQNVLRNKMNEQLESAKNVNKINPILLNSISWSAGCISGAMTDNIESDFLVLFIRGLLSLCEIIKGKGNKAICASNIMYVVGQYPAFMNSHYKFMKVVVKKIFEFMHENFEGVQDFACETFLKISMKCGKNFVVLQDIEKEPYINELVRNVSMNIKDLKPHQKLMYYEAIGNIIYLENNMQQKIYYISQLMSETNNNWNQVFSQTRTNPEILKVVNVVQCLKLIICINERVSFSTKTAYWSYGNQIFKNMIDSYIYYSNIINNWLSSNTHIDSNTKQYVLYNKTLIKFFISLVKNTNDNQIIAKEILPPLAVLLQNYSSSHPNNKEPNILLLFSSILDQMKNSISDFVIHIWKFLCVSTLELIKNDCESMPEHRINFFILLKSLITNSFESLFKAQNLVFNKDVIDSITYAINHSEPKISETGLETMLILLEKVLTTPVIDGNNILDPFFQAYFFIIFNDIFSNMTDGFHQSGFKLQVKIIAKLIEVVDVKLSNGILQQGENNKNFFCNKLLSNLLTSFQNNITNSQGEAFCLALFNHYNNEKEFKRVLRDFLVCLKSFRGNNETLWEEEKQKELELANQIEQQKKHLLPAPQYDSQINANNYQNNI